MVAKRAKSKQRKKVTEKKRKEKTEEEKKDETSSNHKQGKAAMEPAAAAMGKFRWAESRKRRRIESTIRHCRKGRLPRSEACH